MKRFLSAALVAFPLALSIPWIDGGVPDGTASAAPRKKVVIDQSLIADTPENLGPTKEIQAASRAYLAALRQGNGQAIAAFWTTHGVYVDSSGQSFPARELALREFTEPVAKETAAVEIDTNSMPTKPGTIHWVTPIVALQRGTTVQQVTETGETAEFHFLAVWVQQDQRWLLNYLQDTLGQKRASPGKLDELEWMVGQWITPGTESVAQLSVRWSADKKYLVQQFKVDLPGKKRLHGEQRIGWDPSRKAIRSWIFRSDGGFSESSWSREGDTWIVKTQGTGASGVKTSAVDLWALDGPDRCWFKSLRLSSDEATTDDDDDEASEVILHFQRTEE